MYLEIMESQNITTSKEFVITNKLGLHARPCALFVKTASRFPCEVWIEADDQQTNGKSIMGLMMLAAAKGTRLIISTEGDQAEEALKTLGDLIESNFEEED